MMTLLVLGFLAAVAAWLVYGYFKDRRKYDLVDTTPSAPPVMNDSPMPVPPNDVAVVEEPSVKTEDPALIEQQPADYVVEAAPPVAEAKKKKAKKKGSVSTKQKK